MQLIWPLLYEAKPEAMNSFRENRLNAYIDDGTSQFDGDAILKGGRLVPLGDRGDVW